MGATTGEWVENSAAVGRRVPLRLGETWTERELLWFFASRDVKVRYKQALLGVVWAVLQPIVGALSFTLVFYVIADVDVDGGSYFTFALVGFAAWTYFSASLSAGARSLLHNADLLTKVAFPRIVAPMSAMLPGLVDLAVGTVLAVVISAFTGELSLGGLAIGFVPGVALLMVAAVGPALLLSAMMVRYRDVGVILGFGLQLMLFATPVAWPADLASEGWRTLLYLNPASGALGLLRAALTGSELPRAPELAMSIGVALALLLVGASYFRRHEREFADII